MVRGLIAAGLVDESRLLPADAAAPPSAGLAARCRGPVARSAARRAAAVSNGPAPAGSASRCSTASPGPARPRPISRRSRRRSAAGRQVLVLLPEIALGAQWLERFRRRFGALPAQWHSEMRQAARRDTWRAVAGGQARGRRRRPLGAVPAVLRARADHRRRGARPLLQAGGRGLLPGARHGGAARLAGRHPDRPGLGDPVARNGRQCRARPLPAGASAAPPRGGRAARRSALDMRRERLRARPFPVAAAGRGELDATLEAGEQVAVVPEPPRLCAVDPVPRLRPPLAMPELHRLAGRAPLYRAAAMPSLRPCRGGAGAAARNASRPAASCRADPGSSGCARRSRRGFPAARIALMVSDLLSGPRAAAELVEAMTARRYDRADRHADRRQGPPLPDADPGRRGRCRSRHDRRRSARRRADLSAAASGRRPRRPRRAAGPRADPDLYAGAAGHAARSPPATATGFSPPRRRRGAPPGCRLSAGWRR